MRSTTLVEYRAAWLDELIPLWRASFEAGVGVTDPNPLENQRQYFLDEVLPNNAVRLAVRGEELVGLLAASSESIAQLYVRVGLHRQGIGTQMLEWAKHESAGSLWLYTFQGNHGACAFYERCGFTAIERGFEPTWRLDDVKYSWSIQSPGPAPRC